MKKMVAMLALCGFLFGFEYSDCCGEPTEVYLISKKPEPKFSAQKSEKIAYKVTDEQIADWSPGYMKKVVVENISKDTEEEE